jgi:hypothetical protein
MEMYGNEWKWIGWKWIMKPNGWTLVMEMAGFLNFGRNVEVQNSVASTCIDKWFPFPAYHPVIKHGFLEGHPFIDTCI